MAAVYKSLSKTNGSTEAPTSGVKKNKQRVLILTSRGVTYRFVFALRQPDLTRVLTTTKITLYCKHLLTTACKIADIATSSMTSTPSSPTAAKTPN